MKPKHRRSEIAALIGREGKMSVETLAEHFDVSLETIRRDLGLLTEQGAVLKVHGGAKPVLRLHAEGSFQDRMTEDTAAKHQIAAKFAEEVQPGDTLFMDTGTTTLIAAAALVAVPGLTVITNSLAIAQTLGRTDGGAHVYLLGGTYAADNGQTVGPMVVEQIDRFHADRAVLTVAALDADGGAMDANPQEASVARAMIRRAHTVCVLATAAKLNRRAAFRVCELDEIDTLICEDRPRNGLGRALEQAGVAVL